MVEDKKHDVGIGSPSFSIHDLRETRFVILSEFTCQRRKRLGGKREVVGIISKQSFFDVFLAQSQLTLEEILSHFSSGDPTSHTERWEIQGGRNDICESERHHRRDPTLSVFQSPTSSFWHHVLLDCSAG